MRHSLVCLILWIVSHAVLAAEARMVSGRVSGLDGEAVVRAVVHVPETTRQSVTDEAGRFSIGIPPGHEKLLVQALGYHERTVMLPSSGSSIDIALEPAWPAEALQSFARQQNDPEFNAHVEHPSWPEGTGPTVAIDEGHHNAHTATGRYRPFAQILAADGYRIRRHGHSMTPENLSGVDVLVIATPMHGLEVGDTPTRSAFKPWEIEGLHTWVSDGGAVLVISDHLPIAGALEALLNAFDVHGLNGYVFEFDGDEPIRAPMVFSRTDGSLQPHPVTDGRTPGERIDSVATFTGFAFRASPEYRPLLVLRDKARSVQTGQWFVEHWDYPRVPVGGWWQGAVADIGAGRIAVIGEAAMFTAQIRGIDRRRNGLTSPEAAQNQQFLLNLMRWLSRA